ncbi:MAG: serine/threonine-protein kinase [Polyangiaceae bacterium]
MGTWPAIVAGGLCLLVALPIALDFFGAETSRAMVAGGPTLFAGLAALAVGLLRLGRRRWLAVVIAGATAAVLIAKPILVPIRHDDGPFSLTSETHLYYLVPGVLGAFASLGLALAPPPRASAPGRTHGLWGVVASSLAGALLALGSYLGGRQDPLAPITKVTPAFLLATLAVVVATRGQRSRAAEPAAFAPARGAWPATEPRAWPTAGAWESTTGSGHDTSPRPSYVDPSMDALLAVVAEAPGAPIEDLVGRRFGPYEVLGLLGAGGMGRVYRTRDHRLLRDVALKLLPAGRDDTRRRMRLLREAQAAAQLNHPHVAQIYDVSVEGPLPYLVMELCEGETLRSHLARGPLPAAEVQRLGRQIAEALAAAHARGIVHRDLKPENVVVDIAGQAKVLDFGLARLDAVEPGHEVAGAVGLTLEGAIVGTPGYMSPEQRKGLPVDARTDVYAFGVLLHELATGVLPSSSTDRAVAPLDASLAPIIEASLQADPDRRPADGQALVEALGQVA